MAIYGIATSFWSALMSFPFHPGDQRFKGHC